MDNSVFPQHHKNMQPGSIAELIRKYADYLEEGIGKLKEKVGDEGRIVQFADEMFDILVRSARKHFILPPKLNGS